MHHTIPAGEASRQLLMRQIPTDCKTLTTTLPQHTALHSHRIAPVSAMHNALHTGC